MPAPPDVGSARTTRPLHRVPPATPAGLLLRSPLTVPLIIIGFLALAAAAAVDHGQPLLTWDEPVQRWVEDHRTGTLDDFFLYMSRFGGTQFVIVGLAVLLLLVWRTCRPLFGLLLVATLARPLIEWTLKIVVNRDRPDLDRLVGGEGHSFPSGHVMAAVALWGLVPPVVALLTHRRLWWWVATVVSCTMIVIVGASRVYLGVHWLSDVVGALLFGSLYLLVVEWLFDRAHQRYPCSASGDSSPPSSRESDTVVHA
jgi:undecaprenyl-diphosphatase